MRRCSLCSTVASSSARSCASRSPTMRRRLIARQCSTNAKLVTRRLSRGGSSTWRAANTVPERLLRGKQTREAGRSPICPGRSEQRRVVVSRSQRPGRDPVARGAPRRGSAPPPLIFPFLPDGLTQGFIEPLRLPEISVVAAPPPTRGAPCVFPTPPNSSWR